MFFRFFTLICFALIHKSRILILNSRIFQYFQRWWGASMLWVVLVLFESNIETCQWEWAWVHGKAFPLIHKQRSQTSLCQRLSRHFQQDQKNKQIRPVCVQISFQLFPVCSSKVAPAFSFSVCSAEYD